MFVMQRKLNIPVEMRIFLYKEKYRLSNTAVQSESFSSTVVSMPDIRKMSFRRVESELSESFFIQTIKSSHNYDRLIRIVF